MKNTPETQKMIKEEILNTQEAIDAIFVSIGQWCGGSFAALNRINERFDSQWPKMEFLHLLLAKEVLTDEDLELMHKVSMTEAELEEAKAKQAAEARLDRQLKEGNPQPAEQLVFAQAQD